MLTQFPVPPPPPPSAFPRQLARCLTVGIIGTVDSWIGTTRLLCYNVPEDTPVSFSPLPDFSPLAFSPENAYVELSGLVDGSKYAPETKHVHNFNGSADYQGNYSKQSMLHEYGCMNKTTAGKKAHLITLKKWMTHSNTNVGEIYAAPDRSCALLVMCSL